VFSREWILKNNNVTTLEEYMLAYQLAQPIYKHGVFYP